MLVVKAAQHVGPHELARYVNFAACDAATAAARYEPRAGRANTQLAALLNDADRRVPACVGAELALCAFSRGAVVLNQLVCELGHDEQGAVRPSMSADTSSCARTDRGSCGSE